MNSPAAFDRALSRTVGAITGKAPANSFTDKANYRNQPPAYKPLGAAKLVFDCTDPEVLVSGPSRTGKSRGWLEKTHYLMQTYPRARALWVRKTRSSLTNTALQTFEDHVLGAGHPLREGPQRMSRQSYVYPNGSEIVVGGMDKATRIMSSEYDLVVVFEAIELTVGDWESLLTRLSNGVVPYQQIGGDTNPDKPTHWLKQRCDSGVTRMIFSDHKDNPVLWDSDADTWTERGLAYISKLDKLTGARKARLRYGKWVQAEGAVYENWNEAIHLIDREQMPKDIKRRFRVVDFGFTNPFVCQWWAEDNDGRLYMYREIYMSQRTVKRHAIDIHRYSEGEVIDTTVADHDAEDRATLAENGISTVAAIKDVSVGIQKVQERLNVVEGDKRPRLFIVRDACVEIDEQLAEAGKPTSTVEEITGYAWMKSADGKPIKEQPEKVDDHGMDAMRYLVMRVDRGFGVWFG